MLSKSGFAFFCVVFALVALFGAPAEAGSNGATLAACDTLGDPHVVFPSRPTEESPFGVFFDEVAMRLHKKMP